MMMEPVNKVHLDFRRTEIASADRGSHDQKSGWRQVVEILTNKDNNNINRGTIINRLCTFNWMRELHVWYYCMSTSSSVDSPPKRRVLFHCQDGVLTVPLACLWCFREVYLYEVKEEVSRVVKHLPLNTENRKHSGRSQHNQTRQ